MKPRIVPSMAEAKALPVQWTEGVICNAVAAYVEWWRNTVVPNVYLGPTGREIDVAVMTKAGLLWAFEIKTSLADWKRDLTKRRYPACAEPARFYYVVPETLVQWAERPTCHAWTKLSPIIPEWVPKHAGIVFLRNDRQMTTYDDGVHVFDTPKRGYVHPCKSIHRRPLDPKYRGGSMNIFEEVEKLPRHHRLALAGYILRSVKPKGDEKKRLLGRYQTEEVHDYKPHDLGESRPEGV
jgi:hypothetical protein